MVQKMLEISDEKSCIQMECWTKTDSQFECYYFDKNGIMQKASIPYEKRYMHNHDYYKIVGNFNAKERKITNDTLISINCCHCSSASAYFVCGI